MSDSVLAPPTSILGPPVYFCEPNLLLCKVHCDSHEDSYEQKAEKVLNTESSSLVKAQQFQLVALKRYTTNIYKHSLPEELLQDAWFYIQDSVMGRGSQSIIVIAHIVPAWIQQGGVRESTQKQSGWSQRKISMENHETGRFPPQPTRSCSPPFSLPPTLSSHFSPTTSFLLFLLNCKFFGALVQVECQLVTASTYCCVVNSYLPLVCYKLGDLLERPPH